MTAGLTLQLETDEGVRQLQVAGAVFDCDGLLVDSESIWLQMLREWLAERGLAGQEAAGDESGTSESGISGSSTSESGTAESGTAQPGTVQPSTAQSSTAQSSTAQSGAVQPGAARPEDFLGLSVDDTAARLAELTGSASSAEEIVAQLTERYSALLAEGVKPMPGAVELISELAARVPVAVASNGLRQDVTAMLEQVGILEKVRTVCTLDDVLYGKPEPELYLTAVGRLGVAPECAVAFEDSPAGAESALRAGLTVVGVNHSETVLLPKTYRLNDLHQVSVSTTV